MNELSQKTIREMVVTLLARQFSNDEIIQFSALCLSKQKIAAINTWYCGKRRENALKLKEK